MVRRSAANFNSFDQIIRPLLRFQNFRLVLQAHARSVRWNPSRGTVDSVVYGDATRRAEVTLPARAVVVAAGPLRSAKLLLQSTSADFPEGLGNCHGLLGAYLHDHPNDWSILELDRPMTRLSHSGYVTRLPYAESSPLRSAAMILGPACQRERYLSVVPLGRSRTFGLTTFGTMVPSADNRISLHPTRNDALGEPLLDICLRYDADVSTTITRAHDRLVSILGQTGYRAKVHRDTEKLVPGKSVHFGGTVRMHRSERYGVLNEWNRLHSVDNVAVVDASSFTTGVEKNPTLTSMALALRAGARLADDLGYHERIQA
jgi:choline dehydrogenase-like flavoprotein